MDRSPIATLLSDRWTVEVLVPTASHRSPRHNEGRRSSLSRRDPCRVCKFRFPLELPMFAHVFKATLLTWLFICLATPTQAQDQKAQEPARDQPKESPTPPSPPDPSKDRSNLGHVQIVSVRLDSGKLKLIVKKSNNTTEELFRPYSDAEAAQLIAGRYICNAQYTIVNGEKQLFSPYAVVPLLAACEQQTRRLAYSITADCFPSGHWIPCPAVPRRIMIFRCRR